MIDDGFYQIGCHICGIVFECGGMDFSVVATHLLCFVVLEDIDDRKSCHDLFIAKLPIYCIPVY